MPSYDRDRITHLEERLADPPRPGLDPVAVELEMLADLYLQADSHLPALETIERLLALPEARTLSPARRAALDVKAIACRLAAGDTMAALAQCREVLVNEAAIDSLPVRARLHLRTSDALYRLARYEEALVHAGRSLELAEQAGDISLQAWALTEHGRIAQRTGELAVARDQYEQALALHRRVGDEVACATLRNNLGNVHKNLCEWDTAAAHLAGALEIFRRLGRLAESGMPLLNLGIVFQKQGDWERALEHYRDADQVFRQIGDPLALTRTAIGLGNIARLQRRFSEAVNLFESALGRARSCGARREEVLAMEFLGELEADRDEPGPALERYDAALALAEQLAPAGDLVVEIERRRAEVLVSLQRPDDAARAAERALRLAERTDDRLEYAVVHRAFGSVAWGRGNPEDAMQYWRRAVALLAGCRERLELARTLVLLGRAEHDQRQARRHLVRAAALYAELGLQGALEACERELQRLLGPAEPPAPAASFMGRRHRAPTLVAWSRSMQRVETLARRAAATELSVLITGETGTGKELVARTIHASSPRAQRPFLAVNCGALRADLALSQLFGHRKGAFTGAHAEGVGLVEAAHGGTLFLDEVGELPLDVQVTLLRFLECGEYLRLGETQVRRADVRIIAATNRELRTAEGEKLFRRDLLFRLNEIEIRLPALRERGEDILPLARHFITFYGGLEAPRLSLDADAVLRSYAWPGNVRELENVMKRVAALHSGEEVVDAGALLPFLDRGKPEASIHDARHERERAEILSAFDQAHGNRSRTAEVLGVSRKTLYARLKRLNLQLP